MILKEITVYSVGDSKDIKTWSNVPYFFTKSLESKGIKLNRVNLEENRVAKTIYKYSVYALIKFIYPASQHTYFRSKLNAFLSGRKIQNALKQFPEANLQFFLTYSFSSKPFSCKATAHFGDWTYLYLLHNLQKRKAFWFEKAALNTEKHNIESTDLLISLFPKSTEFINLYFTNTKAHYLGNVVNSNVEANADELMQLKLKSRQILFIGGKKYRHAAKQLLDAYALLKPERPEVELHVVGLTADEINSENLSGVHFHGYLDKNNSEKSQLYYQQLFSARVIVNTQKSWGAFSSLTEAMYFHTPVICQAFEEFTETYGKHNDFGRYIKSDSTGELKDALQSLLDANAESLKTMMIKAHEKTANFTWDNYSSQFLKLCSSINEPAKI